MKRHINDSFQLCIFIGLDTEVCCKPQNLFRKIGSTWDSALFRKKSLTVIKQHIFRNYFQLIGFFNRTTCSIWKTMSFKFTCPSETLPKIILITGNEVLNKLIRVCALPFSLFNHTLSFSISAVLGQKYKIHLRPKDS